MSFDISKDNKGEYYWVFVAKNNEPIARSSESYKKLEDCIHSIRLVMDTTTSEMVYLLTPGKAEIIPSTSIK